MSAETFWARVALYNETWWPVQAVLILVAVFLTYRVIAKPGRRTDVWMKAFLSFALFVGVTILFAVDIWTQKTAFRMPHAPWARALTIAWLALTALYPLVGWVFLGHGYPQTLLPTMPCPLTVFAITLVAAAAPRADRKVFVALLPWALLGLPKCFGIMDCYEDCILFASGVYGLVILIRTWRTRSSAGRVSVPLKGRTAE